MTDNKHGNKTEELLEKQEARQLTEEDLKQVNGGRETPVFESTVSGASGGTILSF